MGGCGRKNQKKILPQPGIELTTTWWSKKLMNFQLKLYHWATEASYRGWQLTIAKLKSVYVLLVFYSCKYKKAKQAKIVIFPQTPCWIFKFFVILMSTYYNKSNLKDKESSEQSLIEMSISNGVTTMTPNLPE
jgi:hypothetical protein